MKYLKLFEEFQPVSRQEMIDILSKTTEYNQEDLTNMSDDELEVLYGEGNHNIDHGSTELETGEIGDEPSNDLVEEPVGPSASDDADEIPYEMYRADGPMSKEELRELHNEVKESKRLTEKKKLPEGLRKYLDAKKGKTAKKEDTKAETKETKKEEKKPVAKKDKK